MSKSFHRRIIQVIMLAYQSEANTALFYTMMAELRSLSDGASPTDFHRFLKELDDMGKLFRVYTQVRCRSCIMN